MESSTNAYYKIPKTMLTHGKALGISTDGAVLYSVLRSRMELSLKNGKIDKNGRIYIYYSRDDAAAHMGWSVRKTIDVFKGLVLHGLLYEQYEFDQTGRQGGKRLYVKLWRDISLEDALNGTNISPEYWFTFATPQSIKTTDIGAYYRLPMALLIDEQYKELTLRSILLYAIILDRLSMSEEYGRVGEDGRLWTTVDRDIIMTELGCSARSLTSAFGELEGAGLIARNKADKASHSGRWRIYALQRL